MLGRAGRGEGARHREQHHLLALEQLIGGDFLDALFRLHAEGSVRNAVANLDRHEYYPEIFRPSPKRDHGFTGDRKSVVEGKGVSVRVDPGGRSTIKKKKQ